MNGTLSFYEDRLSGGDTQELVETLEPYLLVSVSFELFVLRGGGGTKAVFTLPDTETDTDTDKNGL